MARFQLVVDAAILDKKQAKINLFFAPPTKDEGKILYQDHEVIAEREKHRRIKLDKRLKYTYQKPIKKAANIICNKCEKIVPEGKKAPQMLELARCGHALCRDCFFTTNKNFDKNNFYKFCPVEDCGIQIEDEEVQFFVTK